MHAPDFHYRIGDLGHEPNLNIKWILFQYMQVDIIKFIRHYNGVFGVKSGSLAVGNKKCIF